MRSYIFDLDGTLLDSMDVWRKIDVEFLARRGIDVPEDYMDTIAAMSFQEAAEYTIRNFQLEDTVEGLIKEWNQMAEYAYGHTVLLKAGARDYLFKLKEMGAKLAVATSLPAKLYLPALRNHGLEEVFDVICTTDDVGCSKVRPDVFLLAAERMGALPSECIVFEDLPEAVSSAKKAGMIACAVYDEASKSCWEELKAAADYACLDFTEVLLLK